MPVQPYRSKIWDYRVKDDVYTVEISSDSSFIAAGSNAGVAYLFERNTTAFALLLGDASFLPKETKKETDASFAGEA